MLAVALFTASIQCQITAPLEGGILKLEIMRRNSTVSLGRTLLGDQDLAIFYGSVPLPNGERGELVPFNPIDACTPLKESNYTQMQGNVLRLAPIGPQSSVIALISEEGGCSIGEKFKNAAAVPNVVAVIIYGKGPMDKKISVRDFKSAIPGMLVADDTGKRLLKKINAYRQVGPDDDFELPDPSNEVKSPEGPDGAPIQKPLPNEDQAWIQITLYYLGAAATWRSIMPAMLALLAAILMLILFGSIGMHYNEYMEERRRAMEEQDQLPPVTQELIDGLDIRRYNSLKRKKAETGAKDEKELAPIERAHEEREQHWANETCPVCLDEFAGGEALNELPCGHCFHSDCIQPWLLNRSAECPLCKHDVRLGMKNRQLQAAGVGSVTAHSQPLVLEQNFFTYMWHKFLSSLPKFNRRSRRQEQQQPNSTNNAVSTAV